MRIDIGPYSLNVRAPYASGHQLSAGEAHALNELRTQLIKKQMTKQLHDMLELENLNGLLTEQQFKIWDEDGRQLDLQFQFPSPDRPKVDLGPKPGTLAWELREIAIELIQMEAKSLQLKLSEEEFKNALRERERDYAVQQRARERYAARREANKRMLNDLFGD